jgi:hypothetical protein
VKYTVDWKEYELLHWQYGKDKRTGWLL